MARVRKRDNAWEYLLIITLGYGIVTASLRLLSQGLEDLCKRGFATLTRPGRFKAKQDLTSAIRGVRQNSTNLLFYIVRESIVVTKSVDCQMSLNGVGCIYKHRKEPIHLSWRDVQLDFSAQVVPTAPNTKLKDLLSSW